MMKGILSLLFTVLLFSCSQRKVPRGILSHEEMEKVLWEQLEANAYTIQYISLDTSRNAEKENLVMQEKIFQKYHTSKEEFYKSYDYYIDHSAQFKEILDSISAKQSRLHDRKVLPNFNLRKRKTHE